MTVSDLEIGSVDVVELARELIAFDTINPPGFERDCAHFLGDLLEKARFTVSYHEFAEGRTNVVARRGGTAGRRPLCFTGHIDTVPLGARAWSVDPFAGEIRDGKLYGRGISDMKGGVAAFVAAMIELGEDLDNGPGVVLVITAGEETGCEGSRYLADLGNILGKAGALVVAEPTSNYPMVGHKGAIWLKASATGITAHGSMPEHGVNAAYKIGHMLTKLEDFGFNIAPHEVMGGATLSVGTVNGGMNTNSVPDYAELGIDVRTIPSMDHAHVRQGLTSYLAPHLETLSALVDLRGVWTEPADDWVRSVFALVEPMLGEAPQPRSAAYFTDASILTPAYGGVPTLIIGPGEAAMAHQTDEYCFVDRLPQAVDIYKAMVRDWRG